jgi:Holliday junction resolvase RusA-like endonuclease
MTHVREVRFTVYGLAEPKARARVARLPNGQVRSYTPKKTAAWEESIRHQALADRPDCLLDGPLAAEITFYLPRPRSAPKKRKYPDTKPDLDNLAKSAFDALEGLVFVNDSRFVEKYLRKLYGDPPRVEIRIWEME